ncbi:hypothetical protein RND81_05G260800 [Saponaria officinalis]|uniref:G protein gamma domain-containing protein n=1 Tax=Saponaria officinalis TaxID=3572 RepID=A0AAW1KWS5_SAPOF
MSQQPVQLSSDTRGKHRVLAELKRLDQETRFVEEELEQLSKTENENANANASTACKELLGFVDSKPDPLLPTTAAPLNAAWDRWFEGPQDSKGCRCWIL